MLKFQIDQYDMVLSTEKHLDDNHVLFASNVPLVTSKALLSAQITGLATHIATQLENPTGTTVEKTNMRKNLEDQTFVLGSACCSYASATIKPDLFNRCRYTKTDLTRYRDAELVGICTNLHSDATVHAADLVTYSVDSVMLSTFQSSITSFSGVMKNPTEAIARRTTATTKISNLLPQILEMMSVRLDNDIVSMSSSQPDFVETYNNVRNISNSPTSTLSLTVTVVDSVTNAPIANVELEIMGESITRKSSARGYNTIINLVAGSHQLKVSRPGYDSQTMPFVVVSGETTELVVPMKKVLI